MKRMFQLPKQWAHVARAPDAQHLPAPCHGPKEDILLKEMWSAETVVSQGGLPKEIRIPYKTATGEIKYKMFFAGPSAEDVAYPRAVEVQTGPTGPGTDGAASRSSSSEGPAQIVATEDKLNLEEEYSSGRDGKEVKRLVIAKA